MGFLRTWDTGFRLSAHQKKWWNMIRKKNDRDTIIEEIHRTRRRMAEKFGGDITAILEDARKRQEASGRPVWKGPAPDDTMHASGPVRTP